MEDAVWLAHQRVIFDVGLGPLVEQGLLEVLAESGECRCDRRQCGDHGNEGGMERANRPRSWREQGAPR
jgi:hypothetical protein